MILKHAWTECLVWRQCVEEAYTNPICQHTAIVPSWESQYWETMRDNNSELTRLLWYPSYHAADKARVTLLRSGWSLEEDKLPFCWRMLLALIHTSQDSDLRHIFSGLSLQVHTAKTLREFPCPATFYNKLLDIYWEIPVVPGPPNRSLEYQCAPNNWAAIAGIKYLIKPGPALSD